MNPNDRESVHARPIDASPERLFRAFIEPAHLARGWGPNGFSSTFELNENIIPELLPSQRVVVEHRQKIAAFVAEANEQHLSPLADEVRHVR